MLNENVTLSELESNLVDLNDSTKIPKYVMDHFYKWKENQGTIPTGISYIATKGWYIISPALKGKGIIRHFSDI